MNEQLNASRLLTARELADRLGVTPGAIYSGRYRGDDFPPAVVLGPKRLRWREGDVEAWLDSKRDPDGPRAA